MRQFFRPASVVVFVMCCGLVAGCSGGSGSAPAAPATPVPSATPTPAATAVPAPVLPAQNAYSASQAVAISVPSAAPGASAPPITVPLPAGLPAGYGGQIGLTSSGAVVPASTVVQTKVSNSAPAGLPALGLGRAIRSIREPRDTGTSGTAVEFVTLVFTNQVSLATQPSFSFTLPAGFTAVPAIQYYVAQFDPLRDFLGWQRGYEGPGTVSGTTVTFAPGAQTTIFYANQPVYFALYVISTAAATPTPAPVSSPKPAPAPLSAQPAALEFTASTDAPQTIVLSDASASYAGPYAVTSNDATVASATIAGKTVTVTPAAAGFTTVVVSTNDGRQILIPVGVTTTGTSVQ